jgi:hypothetical protein
MAAIRFKKPLFPIREKLRKYLAETHREIDMPVSYGELLRFSNAITLYDKYGADTLWETLIYSESDRQFIHEALRKIYALLKVGGDLSVIDHLYIDRVDYCLYANTHPIRVRIVNKLNDLFDYFYIKQADASRTYGMELEHLLSPNKINYLVKGDTFIEEHIQGIPGDAFIHKYLKENHDFNPLRIAKEFVKFNERSLVQLLGDMRRDNFVVEIIPDFDELHFRMRAIDFDQECYEGDLRIYMPQFFKENNPIINLGLAAMTGVLELQYQKEERTRIFNRVISAGEQLNTLLAAMAEDTLSTPEYIFQLKYALADLYEDDTFLSCESTGQIVKVSLQMLEKYPVRKRLKVKARSHA